MEQVLVVEYRIHLLTSTFGHHSEASRRSREVKAHSLKKGRLHPRKSSMVSMGSRFLVHPGWVTSQRCCSGVSLNVTWATFHSVGPCLPGVAEEGAGSAQDLAGYKGGGGPKLFESRCLPCAFGRVAMSFNTYNICVPATCIYKPHTLYV